VEPTGWIGAILVAGSDKNAFSIYQCRSFQPAAHAQAVSLPIKSRRLEKRPDRTDVRYHDYRSMVQ
jgi:hypothetical protein